MVSYRESMVNYEDVLHLHLNLHVDLELSSSVRMCWVRLEWHNSTLDHRLPEKVRFKWTSLKHLFLNDLKWDKIMHMLLLRGGRENICTSWWKPNQNRDPSWLGLALDWVVIHLTNSDTPPIREIRDTHICIHINNDTSIICNLGWHDLKQAHIIVYKSLVQNAGKPP